MSHLWPRIETNLDDKHTKTQRLSGQPEIYVHHQQDLWAYRAKNWNPFMNEIRRMSLVLVYIFVAPIANSEKCSCQHLLVLLEEKALVDSIIDSK